MKRISKCDIVMGLTKPEVREIVVVGLMALMPKAIAVVVWGCRSKRKSRYCNRRVDTCLELVRSKTEFGSKRPPGTLGRVDFEEEEDERRKTGEPDFTVEKRVMNWRLLPNVAAFQ